MQIDEKILPVVLHYEETGVHDAVMKSLGRAGFRYVEIAEREGVGSMAKAFNSAMQFVEQEPYKQKYIWFVTNVIFEPEVPALLLETMENNAECAAVHPGMQSSHGFINNAKGIEPAHFVEWTAPLVRYEAWREVGPLDETMPYVHFDLDWSHRAKLKGWDLFIDGRARVDHTYLHVRMPEEISRLRAALRSLRHPASLQALIDKWGSDWREKLCKGGNCG